MISHIGLTLDQKLQALEATHTEACNAQSTTGQSLFWGQYYAHKEALYMAHGDNKTEKAKIDQFIANLVSFTVQS